MGLEMFILCLFIIMGATAVVYSVELYAYVCLVLGSIIRDKLRENPENRDLIFEHFKKKISSRKLNYHIVKGSLTERLMSCLDIIYKMK